MSLKLITEPKVYLVGRQEIDEDELARFLSDEGVESWETDTEFAGQKLVEVAGRTCYMSFAAPRPGGNDAYVDHILSSGHGSVLEHAVFNLVITGVSRSFSHELVRHRAGFGYSQLSQRFVDESKCEFVVPPALLEEVAEALAYRARCDEIDEASKQHGFPPLVPPQTLRVVAGLAPPAARPVGLAPPYAPISGADADATWRGGAGDRAAAARR